MYDKTPIQGLSRKDKFLLDLLASGLMIGFVVVIGYLFARLVVPVAGEEKTAAILTFVVLLPSFLVGHLVANLLIKKFILPRWLSKSAEKPPKNEAIAERGYDQSFKLLKRRYQVFALVPALGGILAITPIKPIAIWLNNLFGLDAYQGVLDQEGGLIFLLVMMVVFLLVVLTGAAIGFLIIATHLKNTERLSLVQSLRAFANGKYPAHWFRNEHR
jgi:hypothetical protein